MDRPFEVRAEGQRFAPVASLENGVALLHEHAAGKRAERVIVLGEEDRFGATLGNGRTGECRAGRRHRVGPWEVDLERRPVADFAVDPDVAARLTHDPEYGGQTKAG